jgi:predicted flap endonuclease-1-like 5' DNA nuclease
MNETDGGIFSCRNTCWIVAALLGLVAFLLIGGLWGLIIGIALAVVVALVLQRLFCAGSEATEHHAATGGGAAVRTGAGASSALGHSRDDEAAADAAASAMTGDEEVAAAIAGDSGRTTPAAALDAAAVKADAPAQAHGGDAVAAKPKPKAASKPKPAAKPRSDAAPKAKGAKPKTSATKTTAGTAKPARAPVAKDGKPELLGAPQGAADDLKLIKGVGPKLEQTLNELGVWHYSQIAGWRKKEIEWVDGQLRFKGRIERDDWIAQAKTLAKGGATEFSKRAAKSGAGKK